MDAEVEHRGWMQRLEAVVGGKEVGHVEVGRRVWMQRLDAVVGRKV